MDDEKYYVWILGLNNSNKKTKNQKNGKNIVAHRVWILLCIVHTYPDDNNDVSIYEYMYMNWDSM